MYYLFSNLRKFAFQFKQKTGKGVSVALHVLKEVVIVLHHLVEIAQKSLAFKYVGVGVNALERSFFFILLVIDFPDNLFENVLKRHDSAGASKLVNYDCNMHLVVLKLSEQVVDFLRFRHKIWRSDK